MNKNAVNELLQKENYSIDDLIKIMEILRSEGGCPWDREQTHKSIRNNLIEETYEAVEGIDNADDIILKEELGDILLQVIFHARIAQEENSFDINEVADGVCKKLILRHPHIFSDVKAETSDKVLENWDAIKKEEKNQKTAADTLKAVSSALPALLRASKIASKAGKTGFTYPDVSAAMYKAKEEFSELEKAIMSGDKEHTEEEFGDLLFAISNAARLSGVNPEEALYKANEKFVNRFARMEMIANEEGKQLCELDVNNLLDFWKKAKKI